MRLNRTLFEAGITRRGDETEEEYRERVAEMWRIANLALSAVPVTAIATEAEQLLLLR